MGFFKNYRGTISFKNDLESNFYLSKEAAPDDIVFSKSLNLFKDNLNINRKYLQNEESD